ncbi:MAG: tRNA (N(6)-L-threonylcarbamoyladenosine(37)-C(2))-methylthiotransferase MtaB [Vicinamibacterales bacterium]
MKFAIVTFGCRVNQADSLQLEAQLRTRGGERVSSDQADVVIVNTCSVTASADQGARQTIRRISRENPSVKIVATGCYATRRPDEVAGLPNVVQVVANDEKLLFLRGQTGVRPGSDPRFADGDGACGAAIEPGMAGRTAFTLRVQTGCEQSCAYCIIPTTRGHSRSLPLNNIVTEVRRIAASGFKEIALTGVHLGSYGRDLESPSSLLQLLRALNQVPEDVTFRVSSLEPMDCSREIVDLMTSSGGRFAPHLHLPLQHASNRVLQAMRRPYTLDYYRRLVDDIATRLPHASIGSDMIVGFPGESSDEFAENLAYLPDSPLTHLHVFPYSDRDGTAASRMTDKVDGATIRRRGAQLRAIGAMLTQRFTESQRGMIRPGLTIEDGTLVVTDNYLKVRIPPGRHRNERVQVRLFSATEAVPVASF